MNTDNSNEVATIPHEQNEVSVQDIRILPLEEHIKIEVSKFKKFTDEAVSLKKRFKKLDLSKPLTAETYKAVKLFWQDAKGVRIDSDKLRKVIKADYIAIGKAIEKAYDTIEQEVTPMEEPAYNRIKEFDNAAEIARAKVEQELDERRDTRVKELCENGIVFNGSVYAIEDVKLDIVSIRGMEPAEYDRLLIKVKEINARLLAAIQQKELEEEKEREKQRNLTIENEKKEKELREKQEAIDKKEKELHDKMVSSRTKELTALGMSLSNADERFFFENTEGHCIVTYAAMNEMEEDDWNGEVDRATTQITALKNSYNKAQDKRMEEQKEREAKNQQTLLRRQTIKDRFDMLPTVDGKHFTRKSTYTGVIELSVDATDVEVLDESNWNTIIDELDSTHKKIIIAETHLDQKAKEKADQERQAGLSDAELAKEFLAGITIPRQVFKTQKYINAYQDFKILFSELQEKFTAAVK